MFNIYKFNISIYIYISCIINVNITHYYTVLYIIHKKYKKFLYFLPQEIPNIEFKYVYIDIGPLVYDVSSRIRKNPIVEFILQILQC